jgi:threonine-phosphate decarboxylase
MRYYEHGGEREARLDFSVNTNPLGCPVDFGSLDLQTPGERYPDTKCTALRKALSEKWSVPAERILCGNGASDLILRVCAVLKPQKAFVREPTFSEYERCVKLFGGEISNDDCGVAFICNPNNPTGRLVTEEYVREFLDKGAFVVLDECFVEFADARSLSPLTAEYPNLLVLNAFTKIYAMAGARLGYAICSDADLLRKMDEFGAAWSVSGIAQTVGAAALAVPNFIERTRDFVKTERAYMTSRLTDLKLEATPSAANFLLVKCPKPLCEPLLSMGIAVRDCSNFRGLDARHIRIGLKRRAQNDELLAAIAEVLHG